ncbi:MAG: hypothetical protein ACTSO7_15975 [Candidatus Heimdallarchaeota archaeon]
MADDLLKILEIGNKFDKIYSIYANRKIYEKELEEIKNQRNENVINSLEKLIKKDDESQRLFSKLVKLDIYIKMANEREVPWNSKDDILLYNEIKLDILEKHIKKALFLDELTEEDRMKIRRSLK